MTTLRRDIAPDSNPEIDQCGFCVAWYIVRDSDYGACPEHNLPSYSPEVGELRPRNLYWGPEAGE
jgi:hypothetical protein